MDCTQFKNCIGDIFKSGALDFLCNLDDETIEAFAEILDIDKKVLSCAVKIAPPLFKGEITIKDALPEILPVMLSLFISNKTNSDKHFDNYPEKNHQKQAYSPTFEQNKTAIDLVCQIADNDIFYSVSSYLQSNKAS